MIPPNSPLNPSCYGFVTTPPNQLYRTQSGIWDCPGGIAPEIALQAPEAATKIQAHPVQIPGRSRGGLMSGAVMRSIVLAVFLVLLALVVDPLSPASHTPSPLSTT